MNSLIEVYIFVNKINKTTKASYGIYLKYINDELELIADKKVSSGVIQYKKIEDVIYSSILDSCRLINNKDLPLRIHCSFDGHYSRTKELDKEVKKFHDVFFYFNEVNEMAEKLSKENLK